MKKVFRNLFRSMKYEFERADDFEVCLFGSIIFGLGIVFAILFYLIICCLFNAPWFVLTLVGFCTVGSWFGFFLKKKLRNMEIP